MTKGQSGSAGRQDRCSSLGYIFERWKIPKYDKRICAIAGFSPTSLTATGRPLVLMLPALLLPGGLCLVLVPFCHPNLARIFTAISGEHKLNFEVSPCSHTWKNLFCTFIDRFAQQPAASAGLAIRLRRCPPPRKLCHWRAGMGCSHPAAPLAAYGASTGG